MRGWRETLARLAYLAKVYLWTVLVFAGAKVAFMLACREGQPLTAADAGQVLCHGLSLDLSTALYFLIVPLLFTAASAWVRVPRWLPAVYYALVALAFALAFVADASLYPFWQFKLDASCLDYLAHPADAFASVSTAYLLVRLAAIAFLAFILYRGYAAIPLPPRLHGGWTDAVHLLLVPVVVVGIRGGLSESTTNIGQVYFSSRQFLNHAAVNPVFSFLSSLSKSGDYIVEYRFFDDSEAEALTAGLFDTRSVGPDTLLTTTRPNVLLIVMEGCGAQFTAVGGHPEVTPCLDALSREAVSFTECYASSWRTDRGLVSILSGYPAFPVTSVMKIPAKSRLLPSIARSLSREGYATSFYYGGDINFTNMRSYVMSTGYDQLHWKADYSPQWQHSAQWGVRDDLMFSALLSDIRATTDDSQPWMKTLLTLSSHEPWDVPISQLADPVCNAFRYLDRSLGRFIDSLRQTPQWQQTLVVILPDHGVRYQGIDEQTRLYNHIPMLWLGGAVRQPRRIDSVCAQTDLAATLLGQLRLPHDDFTFSRDVASRNYRRPMAYHTFTTGFTVIAPDAFAAYDLSAGRTIAAEGPRTDSLLTIGRALLQLSSRHLKAIH